MILKKFAEQVARQVGVGVARGRERDAAKVVEKMTTMAKRATVVEAVEDAAEGVEDGGAADRGAEVELAVKAQQEVREVEEGGVVEEKGEGEEVRLTCRQGPVQTPKTAQEMLLHFACWP